MYNIYIMNMLQSMFGCVPIIFFLPQKSWSYGRFISTYGYTISVYHQESHPRHDRMVDMARTFWVRFIVLSRPTTSATKVYTHNSSFILNWNSKHTSIGTIHCRPIQCGNGQHACLSMVDRWFEPHSCKTKDYKVYIWCFSTKHATLRSKSKEWLESGYCGHLSLDCCFSELAP